MYEGLKEATIDKLNAMDSENMQNDVFFNRLSESGHSDMQWYCNG